ncbi:MAG: flavin reductase [Gracilibacter sp. BRH_c7a]|nr:MAG: flavin reductase [Gracilibacter sp. BRH_c7a]
MSWRCLVCDYIHIGENPPDICPVCGVDSSNFVKIEDAPPVEELSPEDSMKKAVRSLSYGLFIISASNNGKDNAQTANTCFQITSEPVQLAIGINKNNYTHDLITQSRKFGVSILNQNGHGLARNFGYKSGRDLDKFQGIKAHRGQTGVLLPDEVLGNLEAEVVDQLDAGTHTIFLGKVIAGEYLGQGEPMTYAFFRSKK